MLESSYLQKSGEYYAYARPEMRAYVPAGIKCLLDVGCARGAFARYFREQAHVETWGVEPMPEAAEEARAVLDHVVVGDFVARRADLPAGRCDAIVFNDVLEHMLEPELALRTARDLLSPAGVVIASIPNFLFWPNLRALLVERDWVYRDAGILDRTHVRFFTRKSMVRLFEETGYVVERIDGINPYVGPPRFRLLRRLLGRRADDFVPAQYAVRARLAAVPQPQA